MSIKGTRTEKNLLKAFAGESQARNRYTYFSAKAKKEGYVQISSIFEETANHEKEHAKKFFKYLVGGVVEITARFPAGKIGSTLENLKEAAAGEYEEWTELYPEFAKIAKEEGFTDVAKTFEATIVAERFHESRYRALIKNIESGTVFKRSGSQKWKCNNCGYIHEGNEAPDACPACSHAKAHFMIQETNWQ